MTIKKPSSQKEAVIDMLLPPIKSQSINSPIKAGFKSGLVRIQIEYRLNDPMDVKTAL